MVIMPMCPTPLVVFGYFLLRFLKKIDEDTPIRFTCTPARSRFLLGHDLIVNLNLKRSVLQKVIEDLFQEVPQGIINKDSQEGLQGELQKNRERKLLRRFWTYCNSGDSAAKHVMQDWIRTLFSNQYLFGEMKEAIEQVYSWMQEEFVQGRDLWKESVVPVVQRVQKSPRLFEQAYRTLVLRKFRPRKERSYDPSDVIGQRNLVLDYSAITTLFGKSIVLAIGGPPGSGKSTLAASLFRVIQSELDLFKSKVGWPELDDFTVEAIDLDLGTPTLDAISDAHGQDRKMLKGQKVAWTKDRALEASQKLQEARRRSNLIIADLPGLITQEQEIICANVDCLTIITHDWEEFIAPWKKHARDMQMTIVGNIQSNQRSGNGSGSDVTTFFESSNDRVLSGRLSRPSRQILPGSDNFMNTSVPLLLFDLLPQMMKKREEKLLL